MTDEIRNRIFRHFEGMDTEYEKLIREYHRVYLNEDLSQKKKSQERLLTIDKVMNLKKEHVEAALAEIEKIKEEYSEKPAPVKLSVQEKAYNLALWTKVMPTMDIRELEALYAEHEADEDFKKLLKAELRERAKEDTLAPALMTLLDKIEHGHHDDRFKGLDQIAKGLKFLISIDMYPAFVTRGLGWIKYRTINKDLELYPIPEGPLHRGIFRLSITGEKDEKHSSYPYQDVK